jgi:hypothetical protein
MSPLPPLVRPVLAGVVTGARMLLGHALLARAPARPDDGAR